MPSALWLLCRIIAENRAKMLFVYKAAYNLICGKLFHVKQSSELRRILNLKLGAAMADVKQLCDSAACRLKRMLIEQKSVL